MTATLDYSSCWTPRLNIPYLHPLIFNPVWKCTPQRGRERWHITKRRTSSGASRIHYPALSPTTWAETNIIHHSGPTLNIMDCSKTESYYRTIKVRKTKKQLNEWNINRWQVPPPNMYLFTFFPPFLFRQNIHMTLINVSIETKLNVNQKHQK